MNGTIRWLDNRQCWQVQIYLGVDAAGKARFKTKNVRTPNNRAGRKEADAERSRLLAAVADGDIAVPTPRELGALTVQEFVNLYLSREPSRRQWAGHTAKIYDENLNRYLCPFVYKGTRLGDMKMAAITDIMIDALYRDMLDRKLSHASVNKVHSTARAMFNRAMRSPYKVIKRNPFLEVEVTPAKNPDIVVPSTESIKRLIAAADRDFAVWIMLASSFGARRGTLAALRFSNLDLDNGWIEFAKAIGDGGKKYGGLHEKGLKADNPYIATLAPHEIVALQALRERRMEQVAAIPREWTEDELVFTPDGTNIWPPTSITHKFVKLAKAAKLNITLHQLKHFAVSTMLANSIDVSKVAIRTGTSERTIINKYRRFIRGQDTAAADLMSSIFGDDNVIPLATTREQRAAG